jgi:hypothetical protein
MPRGAEQGRPALSVEKQQSKVTRVKPLVDLAAKGVAEKMKREVPDPSKRAVKICELGLWDSVEEKVFERAYTNEEIRQAKILDLKTTRQVIWDRKRNGLISLISQENLPYDKIGGLIVKFTQMSEKSPYLPENITSQDREELVVGRELWFKKEQERQEEWKLRQEERQQEEWRRRKRRKLQISMRQSTSEQSTEDSLPHKSRR